MISRDAVVDALRAEDVAAHLGIDTSRWRGRWLRSRRCGRTDHPSEAFGISREGRWHCFACDEGGDLLLLLAVSENLDLTKDFPAILELGARLAGVEDEADLFGGGKPAPRARPEMPPALSTEQRIVRARKRAEWLWDRLWHHGSQPLPQSYLRSRGLPLSVLDLEVIRSTPIQISQELREQIYSLDSRISEDVRSIWNAWGTKAGTHAIALPVRSVADGKPLDVRARRVAPLERQPKIVGMVGGITAAPAERGRGRELLACYGHPERIDSDDVVVVEGFMDYLTALALWPNAQILGAVEAGSFPLVAAHAARALAERDDESRLLLVEQNDPPRTLRDGRVVAGAADQAINEEPNAAYKVAVRHLGAAGRVMHMLCDAPGCKDLNDLYRAGIDPQALIRAAV